MLVLGRRIGEEIVVNDDIIITLIDIRGDRALLGFEADRSVIIHRREVHEAIRRNSGVRRPADLPGGESAGWGHGRRW
jgi:carbon storage regulator